MVARRGEGLPELLGFVADVASGAYQTRPRHPALRNPNLERALDQLIPQVTAAFPGLPNARWVALRLLDGDPSITQAVRDGTLGDLSRGLAPTPIALEVV
jgi:hypothetical protein